MVTYRFRSRIAAILALLVAKGCRRPRPSTEAVSPGQVSEARSVLKKILPDLAPVSLPEGDDSGKDTIRAHKPMFEFRIIDPADHFVAARAASSAGRPASASGKICGCPSIMVSRHQAVVLDDLPMMIALRHPEPAGASNRDLKEIWTARGRLFDHAPIAFLMPSGGRREAGPANCSAT